ncbi:hypothetical protein WJX79_007777 [Trebouxia sp. C0005]
MFLSLEKIMLMLPATGQSRDSFRLQVQQAVEDFCLQYAQHADFVQYISDYYAHKIDEWVRGFRDVEHAQQDTIGACEGYHSAIKGNELAQKHRLQGRRLDWLLHELFYEVEPRIRYKSACKAADFGTNRKKEERVTAAVIAAHKIPDSYVQLPDSPDGTATVTSMQDSARQYQASHATGTAHPMAILNRVQDSWGNSIVRKGVLGLDAFPKARRKLSESAAAIQPAEAEALPFSKPKPSRKKTGPRQQAKAAAAETGQENSSAAANTVPSAVPSAEPQAPMGKPSAVKATQRMRKCGECANCLRPKSKKVCLRNQQQRLAA